MKKPKVLATAFTSYDVSHSIGQGGNGYVYQVSDGENTYAAKVLDLERSTQEKMKRFKNEYIFCSNYNHPNIIKVLDHGLTETKAPFFIMPLYDGSLRNLMHKADNDKRFQIIVNIMDGLEAAHTLKVIHRDVKPENILYSDTDNKAVITDFGIARFQKDELFTAVETKDGTRLANFQYAAPEQRVRGGHITPATDIYSIGLIFNELFTGELALGKSHKTVGEVSEQYSYLDIVIDKMLQQNPKNRFQNVGDLRSEISARSREYISNQKIMELSRASISKSELSYPELTEPTRIIGVSWDNGNLYIKLNWAPSDIWVQQLRKTRGGVLPFRENGPENLTFTENVGVVRTSDQAESQAVIDMLKSWLPNLDKNCVSTIKKIEEKKEKDKIKQLRMKIEAEEKKREINSKLNI